MALAYYLDFTAHIPQKLCPDRNELLRFLNQEVRDLPKDKNILIQDKPGLFKVKVYDAVKGARLENKVVNFYHSGYYEGQKLKNKVEKWKFFCKL